MVEPTFSATAKKEPTSDRQTAFQLYTLVGLIVNLLAVEMELVI